MKILCLDYALNRIDEETIRSIDKKDIGIFIHQIETILSAVKDKEVYFYTE